MRPPGVAPPGGRGAWALRVALPLVLLLPAVASLLMLLPPLLGLVLGPNGAPASPRCRDSLESPAPQAAGGVPWFRAFLPSLGNVQDPPQCWPSAPRPPEEGQNASREVTGGREGGRVLAGTSTDEPPSAGDATREDSRGHAQLLEQAWSAAYGLQRPLPPLRVDTGGTLRAPHLEDCAALQDARGRAEQGEGPWGVPPWACARSTGAEAGPTFCNSPRPPWVVGSDEENLPLTRVAQRDLWVHQFPRNCSAPQHRFLLVDWWPMYNHGIGSQIHLMSAAFSLAYASRRILVPVPGTFHRANHAGCRRAGQWGTMDCYFFPVTSRECFEHARALYRATKPQDLTYHTLSAHAVNTTATRVVRVFRASEHVSWDHYLEATAARKWGTPWGGEPTPFELLGSSFPRYNDSLAQANWWRSQSVRFMLRWPSSYLCHAVNKVRHATYGAQVAQQLAAAEAARRRLARASRQFLEPLDTPQRHPSPSASAPQGEPGARGPHPEWLLSAQPYIPRPIVSVHVRQGDKGKEMHLFSFPSFMWLAERVRLLVPHIRNIWLSTEMQSIVDDSAHHGGWTFFYTDVKRQQGTTSMIAYEKEVGMEQEVSSSFANLIIASQCDFFVGVLGSNWNRLINELRLTGGKKRASYMALNNGEW